MATGTPVYDVYGRKLIGQPGTPITIAFDGSVASASALEAGKVYIFQANVPYYLTPLTAVKVAAIKGGDDAGTLWITPMTEYTG